MSSECKSELALTTTPNIYQRVLNIMAELDYIKKGDKTVNGQYRFASHDDVTAKIHPYLVKHGVVILPSVKSCVQQGNRTEVVLSMRFVNVDNDQDDFTVDFPGYGVDPGDKGPGKAVSYAYKYGILKTFALETGEDPDKDANARYEAPKCLEFDLAIPADLTGADKKKLARFLEHCATSAGKSTEDVKMEAAKRMDNFMKAMKAWKE